MDLVERFAAYKQDPVLFVKEMFCVTPTAQQEQLLRAIAKPGAKVSVRSGHGTGKSTAASWCIAWFLFTHRNAKVPCTAPSSHQLSDILWAELAKWRNELPQAFKDQLYVGSDHAYIVGRKETQFAVARTSRPEKPEALQGFHADNLLFVVDEASGVAEQVFEVAEGALSTAGARVLMLSNPTQTTGYFFRSQNRDKHKWTCLHFSSRESPLVDATYCQDMDEKYGPDSDIVKVRVDGNFPSTSILQLISTKLVMDAMNRLQHQAEYRHAPVVMGADVAYYGDDRCSLYRKQGLSAWKVWSGRDVSTTQFATIIAQNQQKFGAAVTFSDITGVGAGVYDTLKVLGTKTIGIYPGQAAINPNKFLNRRAEMWWEVKEWLEQGGCLEYDEELLTDLTGPQYFYTGTGKIQLEAKDDMKKRGLASPDLGDGLALCFAGPVPITVERVRREQKPYNPFRR